MQVLKRNCNRPLFSKKRNNCMDASKLEELEKSNSFLEQTKRYTIWV